MPKGIILESELNIISRAGSKKYRSATELTFDLKIDKIKENYKHFLVFYLIWYERDDILGVNHIPSYSVYIRPT